MKDYLKVIITVIITFLATAFLGSLVNKSNATQSDLIDVKTESFEYTDKAISQHEKTQSAQFETLNKSIVSVDANTKANKELLQKLLDIQLKK